MAKIFITRQIPGNYIEKLKEKFEVKVSEFERPLTQEELLQGGKGMDGLLTLLTDKLDGDVMDALGPSLKVISNYAVGFDNIDIPAATQRGIVVCNTPCDEVNEAVAEHTWALILSLVRRIVEADEAVRRGGYKGWEPDIFLGNSLKGKTLGIVGLGRIGSMVARRAKGYEMNVIYNKHNPDPDLETELGIKFADLATLLGMSDIVTIHVPLTEETKQMFGKDTISKMKNGSFLVNTARGQIVDEDSLVEALKSGHLKGAALDVYENEPNIHPELIGMENVILTPHIGSATLEAREKMGQMSIQGIIDTLEGKIPENIVNKEVWENRRK